MGHLEKLWTKSHDERTRDPEVLAALDAEEKRWKESWVRLGNQTKETCSALIYNSTVRPFVRVKHGKEKELNVSKQLIDGSVDSTAKILALVGRVLLTTGRTAHYGIRQLIKI